MRKIVQLTFGAVLFSFIIAFSFSLLKSQQKEPTLIVQEATPNQNPQAPVEPKTPPAPTYTIETTTVASDDTFIGIAQKKGFTAAESISLVKKVFQHFDLAKLEPGLNLMWHRDIESQIIQEIFVNISPVKQLQISKFQNTWVPSWNIKPITIKITNHEGIIHSTLWESMTGAELTPNLIADLADIFAWQIDFEREIRPMDRWFMVLEKEFVENEFLQFGKIIAARIERGRETHSAFLHKKEGRSLYYNEKGESMKSLFLKSPLSYTRISSRFQRKRYHPILKINRPHLGVDYAAPSGTPVKAVGDGKISYQGWRGGSGRTVIIRHNRTYKTAYKHLSKVGKGIRKGAKVYQGQTIGYVGQTGLATGPHLHFEFYERGRYIDPLGRKFPRMDSLAGKEKKSYLKAIQPHKEVLDEILKTKHLVSLPQKTK